MVSSATGSIGRRGLLLVLSSPSGAGKTTLARRLLERDPFIKMSISCTTRPPRPGERHGFDYHFVDRLSFEQRVEKGDFLEYAEVFGNFYGTPRAPVEHALKSGQDVLFDIDWQGTQQLSQIMPEDVVRIFVLPPTAETLKVRLVERAQDALSVVAKRMAEASREISHWPEYDYVIVNSTLLESDKALDSILMAERLKRVRQTGLMGFVRSLLSEL